jgi:hypothetical protein
VEIFFSPESLNSECQILNVVEGNQKPIGYLSFISDDKKIYIYGHLENEGVSEIYKDMVRSYIQGLAKSKEGREIYSYIAVGGKKLEINNPDE